MTMKNIENILLDLDGTLTDPKEGITKSVQYSLQRLDVEPPSMDELEWVIGPPLTAAFAHLLQTKDSQRIQKAIELYRERYENYCAIENKPYEGIHDTLAKLKEQGFNLYLATSKPWAYAGKILDYFNMRNYFTEIHGSELDGTRDYKEDLIAYILQQHNMDHKKTLMIGDRSYDIRGAKYNKVRAVGVTYGYGSLEEILAEKPDAICDAHHQILQIVSVSAMQKRGQ